MRECLFRFWMGRCPRELLATALILFAWSSADASVPGVETGPTNSISGLTQTSVNLMGGITNLGGTTVTNAGFFLNTNSTATNGVKYSAPGTSFGLGPFSNTITGLTPGTSYYYRAFAANSVGTGYGTNEYSFTTPSPSPFTYTNNGTNRTITGYTGGGVVEIPATIGGGTVTAIGNNAFQGKTNLTTVFIPNGVTAIGEQAFAGCISMKSITLPNSLSSIGKSAFVSCQALESISIPNLVTAIESDTFSQCENLASVSLPSNLTRIESGAFAYCYYKLTTITIPRTVTKIVGGAFYDCLVLTEVKFEGPYPDITPIADPIAFRLNDRSGEVPRNAKGYYLASESGTWTGKTILGLTLVQSSNKAPTLAGFSILPIVQESFSSSPLLTGIINGSASISGGECILTPANTGQNGYLAMNKLAAASPTAFSAQFDYRAYDGSGADGTSFSYGNFGLGWTNYYENGLANGLVVRLNEYISKVEAVYNGISLGAASFNPMNPDYRTVVIQVDLSGQLSVSIGGTFVLSKISLPAAYATADKSAWQFVFGARCGGQSNQHSLKNLLIRGVGVGIPSGFTFTEDQPGNLVFSGTPFADEDSTNLTVTLSVQDGTITGNAGTGITVGGTATARTFAGSVGALNSYFTTPGTISYLGAPNNATARQMTITVADGGSATSQIIEINFTPVNDAPILAEIPGPYSGGFNQPQTIPLSASDVETPIEQLVFTVNSSNPTLFPSGSMNVARSGMAWELVATPATGQSGDADITVTVTDGNGALASRTFRLTVNKATPKINPGLLASAITFGQTLANSSLSGSASLNGTEVLGRFAFTTPSTAPSAGTAPQSVTFTPTQIANYNTVTTSVSVTVNKATPTITALPGFMSATGGTVSRSGDFIIHTFTNVGSSTFKPTGSGTVEILVVAGGGGAGYDGGGGGGAGGVITNTVSVTAGTDYAVVVGGGGAAATGPQVGPNGSPGGNSQFGSVTAIGGAGGYNGHAGITAITTGGSGGGQGFIDVGRELIAGGPGLGTSGQGNQGGYSYNGSAGARGAGGGGGGGAGGVGSNASYKQGGNGGIGIQSDISGVAAWYGGGGSGGSWEGTGGTGGMGGGGNGGGFTPATAGANGIANTGGGGGGNGFASSSDSGNGGSGIVIVRYKPNIFLTYGQLSGDAAFSGAIASVPGSFAFANPSAAVGTSSQNVIFTPTDTVNYNTATRSVSVTVTKADPEIATSPTATSIAYGQTLAFSTLSGGVASVPGRFDWTTPSTAPSAGTALQSVTFTPDDRANYNTVPTSVSVTVNQALISSGFSHTLYLGAGATTVTAWGLNTDGRLGVGNMDSPVNWAKAVDGDFSVATVTGLAAGGTHSLILANGKVYAAGSDRFGQLGQGGTSRINQSSFIQVFAPTSRVVAVSAGGNHSLALTELGDVYACGDNTYGQLGNSTLVSSANWIKVSIQYPSTGLSPKIVSVVAGADHNLAVDEGGGVWVWGRNNYGQLGKGTRTKAEGTPSELNLGKINDNYEDVVAESVAAGFSHSLILTTDGKVLGFGRNNSGQTGQSATSSVVLVPTLISGLSDFQSISAGTDSSFAITDLGQLYSWGYNSYGELLLGYASPSSSPAVYGPTPSPICDNVSVVSGGGYSSLAWGAQGLVFGGRNDVGQAGNGPDPDQVVGDYTYTGSYLTLTNLTMDLAGTEPSLYDQIFLGSGAVTLNGILNLMFVGTYTGPVFGTPQTFDLIWATNGITLSTGYKLAVNQPGYLVESKIVGDVGKEQVLQATVRAVESNEYLDALVASTRPSLDKVQSISYSRATSGTGVSTLSVSPSPVEDRVEMIYSYTRPTGGVMSGAEYFFDGSTYRVEYTESLQPRLVVWNPAVVTGTTITPLGDGYERATLRISATGSLGFLRLTMLNPQATGINAGVGSATGSAGVGSATSN